MRSLLILPLALVATLGMADDISGPNRKTLVQGPWGSIFYEPSAMGSHQFESKTEGIFIKSASGEVKLLGTEVNGYRLVCGRDLLTLKSNLGDLDIQWKDRFWKLRAQNGEYTLSTNAPTDSVTFKRNANVVTAQGSRGGFTVHEDGGNYSVQSSAGSIRVQNDQGNRKITGIPFHQLPYFGRGVYISFHGVGILIDLVKVFPMGPVSEWCEWKPILGKPFDARATSPN